MSRIHRVGLELIEKPKWKQRAEQCKDDLGALDCLPMSERIVEVKRPKKRTADNERVLEFVISDANVDRDFDKINPKGWDLKAFRRNPMVLFAHQSALPPIALASETRAEDESLISAAEFHPPDLNPFADMIYRMYAGGWMRAVSVGFRPIEWMIAEDEERRSKYGFDFQKQELLEWSCVPIPANPQALMRAHEAGVNTRPLKHWCEQMLDLRQPLQGIGVNDLEQAWSAVKGPTPRYVWIDRITTSEDKDGGSELPSMGEAGTDAQADAPTTQASTEPPTPLPPEVVDAPVVIHVGNQAEGGGGTVILFSREPDGRYTVLRGGVAIARCENPDEIEWDSAGVITLRTAQTEEELVIEELSVDETLLLDEELLIDDASIELAQEASA